MQGGKQKVSAKVNVDEIIPKLLEHDFRFDEIDIKFDKVDARFDEIDVKINKLEGKVNKLEDKMFEHDVRFDNLEERLCRVENQMLTKTEFGDWAEKIIFEFKSLKEAYAFNNSRIRRIEQHLGI